jgi:hypothetical protein
VGIKDVFKKIWKGVQIAAPFLGIIPVAGAAGVILTAISHFVVKAEDLFDAPGSGVEKAQFVSIEALKVAEAVSGKNFDSPAGRRLIASVRDAEVAVRNAQALYAKVSQDLKEYAENVKEPARDDTDTAVAPV